MMNGLCSVRISAPRPVHVVLRSGMPVSGREIAVCLPVDLGKSGGKIRPIVAVRNTEGIHLKFEGDEESFPCNNLKDTFVLDESGLNSGIASALSRASGQFDPSIPRIITVDTVGAGFKIVNSDGTVHTPLTDYLHPQAQSGMNMAAALTRGGRQEALRQIALATAGQSGVGVYNLYHLIGIEAEKGIPADSTIIDLPAVIRTALCGRAESESSFVRVSLCGNTSATGWNEELLKRFNIPVSAFPAIVPTAEDLGPVLPSVLEEMNCEKASVVAAAEHDTAGAIAGLRMCSSPEDLCFSTGTWNIGAMGIEPSDMTPDFIEALFKDNLGIEGATGAAFAAGNVKGGMLVESFKADLGWPEHEVFNLLSRGIEGDQSFGLVDVMSQRFGYEQGGPVMKPVNQFLWDTGQRIVEEPHFLAATIFVGMVMGMADRIEQFAAKMQLLGREPGSIQVGGGLGLGNNHMMQALADVTGLPVRLRFKRMSGLGNAALALIGAGLATKEEMRYALEEASSPIQLKPDPAGFSNWRPVRIYYQGIQRRINGEGA